MIVKYEFESQVQQQAYINALQLALSKGAELAFTSSGTSVCVAYQEFDYELEEFIQDSASWLIIDGASIKQGYVSKFDVDKLVNLGHDFDDYDKETFLYNKKCDESLCFNF